MLPLKRQELILQELQENRFVQVKTLAKDLNVSELTIRRDLDILGTKGLLERTHGGASLKLNLNLEPEYEQKMSKFPTEKKAIGLKAASLVKDGDIVMVNSGTTTAEVLRAIIQSRKAVTIITNNIDVFSMDNHEGKCKIIVPGGIYRPESHSISSSMSLGFLDTIYANKAFIGVDGLTIAQGITTPIYEESVTSSKMVEQTSGIVYVVASHDKIGIVSNYCISHLDKVGAIITDHCGAELLKSFEDFDLDIKEID